MFKYAGAFVIILAIAFTAGCRSTANTPDNSQPALHVEDNTGHVLVLEVTDADGDDVAVSVEVPEGFAVDKQAQTVPGGNGTLEFFWDRLDDSTDPVFNTVVTVADGRHQEALARTVRVSWPIANPGLVPGFGLAEYGDMCNGELELRVPISSHHDQAWTVNASTPAGFTCDNETIELAPWQSMCVFTYHAVVPGAGAAGEVALSLYDGELLLDQDTVEIEALPVGANTPPVLQSVVWQETQQGRGRLRITATDADNEKLWVYVQRPLGFREPTEDFQTLEVGQSEAVFEYRSFNETGGAAGTIEIMVADIRNGAVCATQDIVISPAVYSPPVIDAAYWLDLGNGTGRLYLYVTEPAKLPYKVSCEPVAGFTFTQPEWYSTMILFTAVDPVAPVSGEAHVTVTSTAGTATRSIPIQLAPLVH